MKGTQTALPKRRFAPIPIETTFAQYRTSDPATELTPSPSPREARPPSLGKRRFAPQLVESSVRRSRRAGDEGPATKPTDKTDITPYTKHIYALRSRRRHGGRVSHGRRESCDEEIAEGAFDLVARDAKRKLQEVAMSAFPNSGLRIGGVEHYCVRDASDDDDSLPSSRGRASSQMSGKEPGRSRRNSSEEDVNWAFREMQEHASILGQARDRISSMDLDKMSIDGPPSDAMSLTRSARQSLSFGSPMWIARQGSSGHYGEPPFHLVRLDSTLPVIGESLAGKVPTSTVHSSLPPAEAGFRSPFRRIPAERDMSIERAQNLAHLRANHAPPMLGKNLRFRICPSPQQTKMEPDRLWDVFNGTRCEEQRDPTGQKGLWRGYCYGPDLKDFLARAQRPALLVTPLPPATPRDLIASVPAHFLSEEPTPVDGRTRTGTLSLDSHSPNHVTEHRGRHNVAKGLRMLQGLEERLQQAKAVADLEEHISAEFDDGFITQVYNYLSLGYPATAIQYDDELSKISRINVEDLQRNDEVVLDSMWSHCGAVEGPMASITGRRTVKAVGHILEKKETPEEQRCPRWRALKLYIFEWARQHPDLNAISPLAWGVRERRGSWGI